MHPSRHPSLVVRTHAHTYRTRLDRQQMLQKVAGAAIVVVSLIVKPQQTGEVTGQDFLRLLLRREMILAVVVVVVGHWHHRIYYASTTMDGK